MTVLKVDQAEEMFEVLDIIIGEFESDPMSVQCFDLRIVDRAIKVIADIKKLNPNTYPPRATNGERG